MTKCMSYCPVAIIISFCIAQFKAKLTSHLQPTPCRHLTDKFETIKDFGFVNPELFPYI